MEKRKSTSDSNSTKKANTKKIFSISKEETFKHFNSERRINSHKYKECSGMYEALEYSKNNGMLPVFAFDIPSDYYKKKRGKEEDIPEEEDNGKKPNASKRYQTTGYDKFTNLLFLKPQIERTFYEIMLEHVPCHLMIDTEIDLEKNKNVDVENIATDFQKYVIQQFIEEGYCKKENEIEILVLDSSIPIKFSRHYSFKFKNGKMFENNYHCGAFMRKVRNSIQNNKNEKLNAKENRFFFWERKKKKKDESDPIKALNFFADMGIYTKTRLFRIFGNTKLGRNSYLLPFDENDKKIPIYDIYDKKEFMNYYIQKDAKTNIQLICCKNPDGSDPWSSSDRTLFRPDLDISKISKDLSSSDSKELNSFYSEKYPFELIWNLFGDNNREVCFSWGIRYDRRSRFKNSEEFKESTLNRLPEIIHFGPIFHPDSKIVAKRELIFDIDLNDYNDENGNPIRRCCGKEKKCCEKCWRFIIFAKNIMKELFGNYLKLSNIMFFFSGGKGMHCWIMDNRVSTITENERKQIISWLDPSKINMNLPHYQKIYTKHCLPIYKIIFEEQNIKEEDYPTDISKMKFLWPRFDKEVTYQLNRAIKSPFALHSVTKKIASFIENDEFPK
jgi:DNA primase small subunit